MTSMAGIEAIVSRVATLQAQMASLAPPAIGPDSSFAQALETATTQLPGPAAAATTNPTISGFDTGRGGDAVVAAARRYLGVRYLWGGTDPRQGLDCSGLVQRAYRDLGIELPRVAADQARMGQPVASLADARPGDLVAFGSPVDHIGIYPGNRRMVVAPHTGTVVQIEPITQPPTAIRRIIPGTSSAGGVAGNALPAWATTGAAAAYAPLLQAAGAKYGVPPALLAAVARAESNFNPGAVSSAGAQGLMQLMPSTAAGLGVDPADPAQAIDGAARLLAGNLRTFGSVPLAVAAYNAGGGAVARYDGIPPYHETQAYVRRVLAYAGEAQ
jgi:cell wall-associated NlpC family hydrolase